MTLFRLENGDYIYSTSEIVNKRELLDILKISKSTLQRMMRRGLPFTMFGGYAGFNVQEVKNWLMERGYTDMDLISQWQRQSKQKK